MWNFDLVIQELAKQKKNGKTQRGLAEYIGVTEQQVSDWKRKRVKHAWVVHVPKIAEYLEVPPETFDDEPENWTKKELATSECDELTDDEADVLANFRSLSSEQQALILAQMRAWKDMRQ